MNGMGHYGLSVVSFDEGPPELVRGPKLMAQYFYWVFVNKRADMYTGGLHLPLSEGGLYRCEPPSVHVSL